MRTSDAAGIMVCRDGLLLLFALRGFPLGYPFQMDVRTVKIGAVPDADWDVRANQEPLAGRRGKCIECSDGTSTWSQLIVEGKRRRAQLYQQHRGSHWCLWRCTSYVHAYAPEALGFSLTAD